MSRRGWLLFLTLSLLWGVPYLFIRVAVEHVSPAIVVCGRCALAALLLLPVAAARGALRGALPAWRWLLVFAAVEIALPFGMLGYAEQHISSSLAGLLVAAVPLLSALVSRVAGTGDRIDRGRMVGLLVGLGGVAALVGIDVGGGDLLAAGAVGLAAFGYACGPVIAAAKLSEVPGVAVSAVALGLNAVAYAPAAWLSRPTAAPPLRVWVAIVVLGVVCSAVAFLVFFALVAEVGPARTTVITYLNPAVAVALGIALLGERLTTGILVGFPLVLLGSWLATRRSGARQQADGGSGDASAAEVSAPSQSA